MDSGGEAFDLVALLNASDLTPKDRRMVFDVIVNGTIEGAIPDRETVLELIELVAARISGDGYRQRIIDRLHQDSVAGRVAVALRTG
ncbi:hypothetical protein [Mycolicibacterium sp. lyk4-40-TYG-92]|uniref:hypothetical protein n=1 Tax=Mycolicibacterium sp. lyk4-40-TYG-92 TaxID=3040295 RepID=UPI00255161AD|nr:hypothetical protein [Mycolicibacterium sp. lyk4-40-TYG-92]